MVNESELLMVTVSGRDRPGLTAALSQVMLNHNVRVVDVEQASLRDLLGLSFLLDISSATSFKDSVIKDLLFEASRLDLSLNFRLYTDHEVIAYSRRNLWLLTFFDGTRALAELSAILAEEQANINSISSSTRNNVKCIEMIIDLGQTENLSRLKKRLMVKGHELQMDLALQKMNAYRKNKRLIFFDMDSTLVDMEIIDEMAKAAGVHREVARITEKAMRGDFDFEESLIQRVAFLKGLTVAQLNEIRGRMLFSDGVPEMIETLKMMGYKIGVVTGGFKYFADYLKAWLGLDFAFANQLEIKEGIVTGRTLGTIIDAAQKARIVNQVARENSILLDQAVAVGDGANDALMLGQVGLGIAYNAKPGLDRAASVSLGKTHLMNTLYLLGIDEEDVSEAVNQAKLAGRFPPARPS